MEATNFSMKCFKLKTKVSNFTIGELVNFGKNVSASYSAKYPYRNAGHPAHSQFYVFIAKSSGVFNKSKCCSLMIANFWYTNIVTSLHKPEWHYGPIKVQLLESL